MHSTVTGRPVAADELDGSYWFANLRSTVRLDAVVTELLAAGHDTFVEVSPHPVLLPAIEETADATGREITAVATLRRDEGGPERLLGGLAAGAAVTLVPGCGAVDTLRSSGGGTPGPGQAALLLPLSGASSDLGALLDQAVRLGGGPGIGIDIFDAGSTPDSAVTAARTAVDSGAQMLVGPVFGAQAQAVSRAVGSRVPVVTLSNDASVILQCGQIHRIGL